MMMNLSTAARGLVAALAALVVAACVVGLEIHQSKEIARLDRVIEAGGYDEGPAGLLLEEDGGAVPILPPMPGRPRLGAASSSSFRCDPLGPNANLCEWGVPNVFLAGDASVLLPTLPPWVDASVGPLESQVTWALTVVTAGNFALCNGAVEGCLGTSERRFAATNYGGVFAAPDSSVVDEVLAGPGFYGPIAGTTTQLVFDGGRMWNAVYCPIPCFVTEWTQSLKGAFNPDASADATAPPILSALTYPLYAPASPNGSTPEQCFNGSNLSGVAMRVCGNVATVDSGASSSSKVCIHWPTNTASGTPCDVVASNAGGSSTLTGVVGILPASVLYAWYCGQGFTAGTSWTDLVSGVVATVNTSGGFAGFTAPGFNATWNGSCALNFTLSGNDFQATFPSPLAQNGSAFYVSDFVSVDTGTVSYVFDGLTAANRWIAQYANTPSFTIGSFQGGAGNSLTSGTAPVSHTPYLVTADFAGASSGIAINNGTPTTGTFTAPATMPGVTMGSRYDGVTSFQQRFSGNLALLGFTAGGGTVLSGADKTILQAHFARQW